MAEILRWLAVILNAALIVAAIGTDVTMAGSYPRPVLGLSIALTVVAVAMLPYFYIRMRATTPDDPHER